MTLLGSPIHDNATPHILQEKLRELKTMAFRLQLLDAHDALFLLKNCFYIPRLQYILRRAPCIECDVLKDFDSAIREALQFILNFDMDITKLEQCYLPVALGGRGIRSASSLSLPAFLSSGHACQSAISKVLLTDLGKEYKPLDEARSIWLEEMNMYRYVVV